MFAYLLTYLLTYSLTRPICGHALTANVSDTTAVRHETSQIDQTPAATVRRPKAVQCPSHPIPFPVCRESITDLPGRASRSSAGRLDSVRRDWCRRRRACANVLHHIYPSRTHRSR